MIPDSHAGSSREQRRVDRVRAETEEPQSAPGARCGRRRTPHRGSTGTETL